MVGPGGPSSLDVPPWISLSGFMCLSSHGLLLPLPLQQGAFLGACGTDTWEVAASSELPESKVGDIEPNLYPHLVLATIAYFLAICKVKCIEI